MIKMRSAGLALLAGIFLYVSLPASREMPVPEPSNEVHGESEIVIEPVDKSVIYEGEPEKMELRLDPKFEKDISDKKKPVQGLFTSSLETAEADGKIALRFTLKNVSGKDLRVHHGSGQKYDFIVRNERGEEVYRWSYNKAFTTALIEFTFGKDRELSFTEEWDLLDVEGNPVPPGKYEIVFTAAIGLDSGTPDPEELTARTVVEIDRAGEGLSTSP